MHTCNSITIHCAMHINIYKCCTYLCRMWFSSHYLTLKYPTFIVVYWFCGYSTDVSDTSCKTSVLLDIWLLWSNATVIHNLLSDWVMLYATDDCVTACESGTYKSEIGNQACDQCPPLTVTSSTASERLDQCQCPQNVNCTGKVDNCVYLITRRMCANKLNMGINPESFTC